MKAEPRMVRLTQEASKRFVEARRLRKWSYQTIAEEAIKSLFATDPELSDSKFRRKQPA